MIGFVEGVIPECRMAMWDQSWRPAWRPWTGYGIGVHARHLSAPEGTWPHLHRLKCLWWTVFWHLLMTASSMMESRCWTSTSAQWTPDVSCFGAWDGPTGSWPGSMRAEAISGRPGLVLSKRNSTGYLLRWQDGFYSDYCSREEWLWYKVSLMPTKIKPTKFF